MTGEQFLQPYYMYYDGPTNSLFFTDYVARLIFRYDFHKKKTYRATIENNLATSFIIPVYGESDKYAVCYNFSVAIIKWNGKDGIAKFDHDEFTVEQKQNGPIVGFDYGKVAPNFDIYCGSFQVNMCTKKPNYRNAAFYHYTTPIYKHLRVCGAIDFDEKNNYIYLCNTCERIILQYKWDPKTGKICK